MDSRIDAELERALLALRVSGEAFDKAIDGMRATMDAIQLASHAQTEAIDAVVAALRLNHGQA